MKNRVIVMDDEKYFTLSHSEMKGSDEFPTSGIENSSNDVKYKAKEKLYDKVLVWCVISQAGVSTPCNGRVRGEPVDTGFYCQKCSPKLINFINIHHHNDDVISSPEVIWSHYARMTREWLDMSSKLGQ